MRSFILNIDKNKLFKIIKQQDCPFQFDIFLNVCRAKGYTYKGTKCRECWNSTGITAEDIWNILKTKRDDELMEIFCLKCFTVVEDCDNSCEECWKKWLKKKNETRI